MRERLTERGNRCDVCGELNDHAPGEVLCERIAARKRAEQPCSGCTALREALAEIAHSMSLDEATFKARKALFVVPQPDASDNTPTT